MVAGNCGLNSHLSELISHIIEPISLESPGCEIDSTSELLSKIDEINGNLENLSTDKSWYLVPPPNSPEMKKVSKDAKVDSPVSKGIDKNYSKNDNRSFGKTGVKTC